MKVASYITWGMVGFFTIQLISYTAFTYPHLAGGAVISLIMMVVVITILGMYNYVQHMLNNGGFSDDKLSPLVPLISGYALFLMGCLFGMQAADFFGSTKRSFDKLSTEVTQSWKLQQQTKNNYLPKK